MATKTIHAGVKRYEAVPQSDGTVAVCKRQKRYDYILDTVCWCKSLTAAKRLAFRLQKLDEIEEFARRDARTQRGGRHPVTPRPNN